MRTVAFHQVVFGLILSVGLSFSTAKAQGPPPGMMMGDPGNQALVLDDAVQTDLGLTEKQKAQLKKHEAAMSQKAQANFEAVRSGELEPDQMMESMTALGREHNAVVAKVLDKNQKTRLSQIELQREGLLAVAKPDIATKIKVTPVQSKKIKTILSEMRQAQFRGMAPPTTETAGEASKTKKAATKSRKAAARASHNKGEMPTDPEGAGEFGPPGGPGFFGGGMPDFNSEEFQAQMAQMKEARAKGREAANAKIAEVLTKEQTDAFDLLLGKPFDLTKLNAPKPTEESAPKTEEATPKTETPAKMQPKAKGKKPTNS